MNIIISNSDGRPIYEQITAQIKQMVLSGELSAGDALPSMRFLAKELHISVITTKRAYEDLERDGYVTTVPGKGCFIAEKNQDAVLEDHLEEIRRALRQAVQLANAAQVPQETVAQLLQNLYDPQGGNENGI